MTAETDTMTTETGDQTGAILGSLAQIMQDQRKVNILLTRIVRDQDERMKTLEDGGGASGGRSGSKSAARPSLEIGKDVPAYPMSDLEFLKKSEVFGGLSDDALRVLYFKGELRKLSSGDTLFEIGSAADALAVIKTGVIEIARPIDDPNEMKTVAYLTNSDSIGENRIVTQSPHRSLARAPGPAEIFLLNRDKWLELLGLVPEFAMLFIEMYAHKLEGTVSTLRTHEERQRQLEGNLEYFDLATVIQTLLSTDQRTGILHVNDDKQQTVAELFVDEGTVKRARMGRLSGEDAFYQLFQADMGRGTFFFKEDIEVEEEEAEMAIPGMSLLMEAARLQDELSAIKEGIVTDPAYVYKLNADALTWDEEDEGGEPDRVLAQAVWSSIGKGMTVTQMVEELPRNEHAVYHVLAELVNTEQIA